MIKIEETEVTYTRRTIRLFVCDLCGAQSKYEWSTGVYNYDTVFDICDACFDNELIPWLESQGAVGRDDDNACAKYACRDY